MKARLTLQTSLNHGIREKCIRIRDVNIDFFKLSFSEKQRYYKIITATAGHLNRNTLPQHHSAIEQRFGDYTEEFVLYYAMKFMEREYWEDEKKFGEDLICLLVDDFQTPWPRSGQKVKGVAAF